jgi:hypothetical protein
MYWRKNRDKMGGKNYRFPNNKLPILTIVLPSSMATSKSPDMPIETSENVSLF